jgi:hypothetical protein
MRQGAGISLSSLINVRNMSTSRDRASGEAAALGYPCDHALHAVGSQPQPRFTSTAALRSVGSSGSFLCHTSRPGHTFIDLVSVPSGIYMSNPAYGNPGQDLGAVADSPNRTPGARFRPRDSHTSIFGFTYGKCRPALPLEPQDHAGLEARLPAVQAGQCGGSAPGRAVSTAMACACAAFYGGRGALDDADLPLGEGEECGHHRPYRCG